MQQPHFFVADAHEGPVWVADQCRLYFTTKTHLDGRRRVDILFLDLATFNIGLKEDLWSNLPEDAAMQVSPQLFYADINMANGMCLGEGGRSLLVAEQGDAERDARITEIRLTSKERFVLTDNYQERPFNSPNKVLRTKSGHLIFSDPDYGFRQGFRPTPQLEPSIYVLPKDGELIAFRCHLEMPHGLALSPDEKTLFVTDTSNDGAHSDDVDLNREKSVWKFSFDPATGKIHGKGKCCFEVDEGVPDGAITDEEHLLVGGGDGVYIANLEGKLTGKIPTRKAAVNLVFNAGKKHLFVTIDDGVLLFVDWRKFVQPVES